MKPISQFGTSMMQLTALVAELRKVVCALEISIEHEEERAQTVSARILAAGHLISVAIICS